MVALVRRRDDRRALPDDATSHAVEGENVEPMLEVGVGDEKPRPGIGVAHLTFVLSSQRVGASPGATPVVVGPRHCAQ